MTHPDSLPDAADPAKDIHTALRDPEMEVQMADHGAGARPPRHARGWHGWLLFVTPLLALVGIVGVFLPMATLIGPPSGDFSFFSSDFVIKDGGSGEIGAPGPPGGWFFVLTGMRAVGTLSLRTAIKVTQPRLDTSTGVSLLVGLLTLIISIVPIAGLAPAQPQDIAVGSGTMTLLIVSTLMIATAVVVHIANFQPRDSAQSNNDVVPASAHSD